MQDLKSQLDHLHEINKQQKLLAMAIMKADSGNFYSLDFLSLAAINRSSSNINGFTQLIQSGNYIAAIPFIRMQIDSVLRLFAAGLVDDAQEFSKAILEGKKVSDMKDKNGKKMRDAYLVDLVSEAEPWIKSVYESGSGFIHLSNKHMFSVFSGSGENRIFSITIGPTQSHVPEEQRVEAAAAMSHVTRLIIALCNRWLNEKSTS